MTMAGATLSISAGSALGATTVYYNKYNAGNAPGVGGTDGWVNNTGAGPDFTGLPSGSTPFGFTGAVANWAVHATGVNDTATVSRSDALATYGVAADIDTAKGAWNDGYPGNTTSNKGWAHNTDIGLFKSAVTQNVTINLASVSGAWNNFGVSVFKGMDSGNGSYSHHATWNSNYCPGCTPSSTGTVTNNGPMGILATDLIYKTHTDNSIVTFTAQAGQVYSILLGGYSGAGNFGPHDGYVASITTSAVPLPAAVWLFTPAIAGAFSFGRRKTRATTA